MGILNTESLRGVVRCASVEHPSTLRLTRFILFGQEKTKTFFIGNKVVEVHSQKNIEISEGDQVVVVGQNNINKFVGWVYVNQTTDKQGGVYLHKSPISLFVRIVGSILLFMSLIFLAKYTIDLYRFFLIGIYVLLFISFTYEPLMIFLAYKKSNKMLQKN